MNRFLVLAIFTVFLLSNCMALRGALFRSGRSMIRNQEQNIVPEVLSHPHVFNDKRSPVVELYPVVDTGNQDAEILSQLFRF